MRESNRNLPQQQAPTTFTLQELLAMNLPRREHLLVPWLRQGESSMVYAAPGVGKSLFALDVALSVAGGGMCLGLWEVGGRDADSSSGDTSRENGWKVLYVDGEMPLDDIRDRVRMLAAGKMQQKDSTFSHERAARNLTFMARHKQEDALADFVNLADEDSRLVLLEKIQRDGFDLVILDNLSTLAMFDDENAASSFNGPVDFLQRLKSMGVACLLVHHTNKSGEQFRGSTKIATTFETLLLLKKIERGHLGEEEDEAAGEAENGFCYRSSFSLSWQKFRGIRGASVEDGTIATLTSKGRPWEPDAVAVWSYTSADDHTMQQVLAAVRSRAYPTQVEIAEVLGLTSVQVHRIKSKVMQSGKITAKEWEDCLKAAKLTRAAAAHANSGEDTDF